MNEEQKGEIILYQTDNGKTKIEVRLEDENVWLSQQQMAELYQSSRTNVVEYIKHIFEEGELDEKSTCRKFRQVQTEGGRSVDYDPNTPESVEFFKIVQNKLHYATHGHTAAERQVRKEQYEYCRGKFRNFRPLTKQRAWQLI